MTERQAIVSRVRQLLATDRNAVAVYRDLARSVDDPEMRTALGDIAREEEQHLELERELLSLLSEGGRRLGGA